LHQIKASILVYKTLCKAHASWPEWLTPRQRARAASRKADLSASVRYVFNSCSRTIYLGYSTYLLGIRRPGSCHGALLATNSGGLPSTAIEAPGFKRPVLLQQGRRPGYSPGGFRALRWKMLWRCAAGPSPRHAEFGHFYNLPFQRFLASRTKPFKEIR
jgi:hypothetical protein